MRFACFLLAIVVSTASSTAANVTARAASLGVEQTFEATAATAAVAAMNALHECRATGEVCEITEVGGQSIRRAAELKPRSITALPLWRFDSATTTVFVGGSMHLLKESLLPLPQPFLDAFDESDVLAVEVNPTAIDEQAMANLAQRYFVIDDGQTLADVLPADTWARLESRLVAFGLPLQALERLKPGFLAVELGRMRFQTLGYLPHLGVEQLLLSRIGDREIHQIETIEAQFDLIGSQPMPVQVAMLDQVVGPLETIEAEVASLVSAWLTGDLDALIDAMADDGDGVEGFDEFMEAMLDERNLDMAAAAATYLRGDQTVFVLVGAGHLGGPTGVIEQLRTQSKTEGWTGRQFASDGSFLNPTNHAESRKHGSKR